MVIEEIMDLERILHPGLTDDELAELLLRENALLAEQTLAELAHTAVDREVRRMAYAFIDYLDASRRNHIPLLLWQCRALQTLIWNPEGDC